MQKVSYMGNGVTTEFAFNFPYFENSNIIVTKNGAIATGYSVVGTSAGLDADIPYTGGKIVFETAPTSLDSITIARSLPLERIIDYQQLVKINPTTMNQDANYLMEVIKDLQDELDSLESQYIDIADKESTIILLAKIAAIHDEIEAFNEEITSIGDISEIQSNISSLQNSVSGLTTTTTTHTSDISTLNTRTNGLLDYVIESQVATAENNYTWYRKYKSGWIEQGGQKYTNAGNATAVTLPIEMANTNYNIFIQGRTSSDGYSGAQWHIMPVESTQSPKTTTGFYAQASITGYNLFFYWKVCGTTTSAS